MSDIRYTKDHEWVRRDGDHLIVGITDYAQAQLGDVVYIEVPETGRALTAGGEAAVVESVKAASEVYAPLSGSVVEGNAALTDNPELVNAEPEAGGWFFSMTPDDPAAFDGLMDAAAYQAYLKEID